jgi:hypothetical protein
MIEARLPGATLQFPDGTPPEAIDKAVAAHIADTKRTADARQANSGIGGFADSVVRKVASGATFGFGDEIAAAGDAALGHYFGRGSQAPDAQTRYGENLANERARDKTFSEDHPVVSTAAEIAGGIAPAILQPEAAAARLFPGAAGRLNTLASGLPAWAQTTGRVVGQGAGYGAVAGFGEGEGGLGERLGSAATGAVTGAVVAPVLGTVVHGAVRGGRRIGDALGIGDDAARAERKVGQALTRDAQGADDAVEGAIARSDQAGDAPVAVVDLGGRGTVNLGATASNTPSQAMQRADQFVELRRGGRPDRLLQAGDEAFGGGSGADVRETGQSLRTQRTADSDPLYREAFSQPAGMTENMGHILNDPIGQQGLRRGLEIQRIENASRRARGEAEVPTHDPAIRFNEAGDPEIVGVPNMRSLDAVKRGMDAILEDARDPTTGRIAMTERLRAIDDMRRTWVGMLDQGNEAYARARAAYGGPSAQLEAMQAGQSALRTNRDVVHQRMAGAPPDVQEAYRLGAGRDFANRVGDPAKASGVARVMHEDTNMLDRLEALIPEPAQRQAFLNSLRQETDMTAVERAVGPRAGSHTARILAGGNDMGKDIGPWVMALGQLAGGHIGGAAMTAGRDVARRIGQGVNANTADALASRLFETDPAARRRVLENVLARRVSDSARAAKIRNALGVGLRGAAVGAGGFAGRP